MILTQTSLKQPETQHTPYYTHTYIHNHHHLAVGGGKVVVGGGSHHGWATMVGFSHKTHTYNAHKRNNQQVHSNIQPYSRRLGGRSRQKNTHNSPTTTNVGNDASGVVPTENNEREKKKKVGCGGIIGVSGGSRPTHDEQMHRSRRFFGDPLDVSTLLLTSDNRGGVPMAG